MSKNLFKASARQKRDRGRDSQPRLRDEEMTILIKFAFWRGLGGGLKSTENCPKTLFFLGNSMTIKFGDFANFIVRNFVVIWEAPSVLDRN